MPLRKRNTKQNKTNNNFLIEWSPLLSTSLLPSSSLRTCIPCGMSLEGWSMLLRPLYSAGACSLRSHGHFQKCSSLERKKKVFADCIVPPSPHHTIQLTLPLSTYKFALTCHNHLNIFNIIMAFEAHNYVLLLKLGSPSPPNTLALCGIALPAVSFYLRCSFSMPFAACMLPPTHCFWSISHSPSLLSCKTMGAVTTKAVLNLNLQPHGLL